MTIQTTPTVKKTKKISVKEVQLPVETQMEKLPKKKIVGTASADTEEANSELLR